jgi:hypothetical protein
MSPSNELSSHLSSARTHPTLCEVWSFLGHGSSAVSLAFESLRQTSAGQFNFPQCAGSQLCASDDSIKTVERVKAMWMTNI